MKRYKIMRLYFDQNKRSRTIKTGLTIAEAQEHCNDPETSSSTCTSSTGKQRTKRVGPWFDSYTEQ